MSTIGHQTETAALASLARLLDIASTQTGGQGRRVADFLLAWHNAEENGGWNPIDLAGLDDDIARDIFMCFPFIRRAKYPDDLGFKDQIAYVWRLWRGMQANREDSTPAPADGPGESSFR
jgi:hypothetical protein